MNVDILLENENLKNKINELEQELIDIREHLKKYTAPVKNKIYYEQNKEAHIQRVKEYKEKTNYVYVPSPEQKKAKLINLEKKEEIL